MRRIRLRTLLLLINLLILILPLAGIWFLRLYESALIRQTESELVAQAAVIVGAFKSSRLLKGVLRRSCKSSLATGERSEGRLRQGVYERISAATRQTHANGQELRERFREYRAAAAEIVVSPAVKIFKREKRKRRTK